MQEVQAIVPDGTFDALALQEPGLSGLAAPVKQVDLDGSVLRLVPAMRVALACPKGKVVIRS